MGLSPHQLRNVSVYSGLDHALDRSRTLGHAPGLDPDDAKTHLAIRLFMNLFESQGLFEADAPRLCRRHKAKIANKEDFPLEDLLRAQPFEFLRQSGSDGKAQVRRQLRAFR